MNKIVVITKQGNWTKSEVSSITSLKVQVSGLGRMPNVLTIEPVTTQQEISDALGHSNFTYAVTDYDKRPF